MLILEDTANQVQVGMSLSQSRDQVISLALQLSKLLKVIRHSDPTAQSKKELLFNKYKENLAQVAKVYCNEMLWTEFQKMIQLLLDHPNLTLEKEEKSVIVTRLLKDFEEFFVHKPKLTEFKKPDVKTVKYVDRSQRASKEKSSQKKMYTRENIREMLIKTQRRRFAAAELKEVINKLNKLGPENLERKIKEASNQK